MNILGIIFMLMLRFPLIAVVLLLILLPLAACSKNEPVAAHAPVSTLGLFFCLNENNPCVTRNANLLFTHGRCIGWR